ncbi:MAG: lytic transglycosylase domain-containing protein [Treponema sp.]|nr:lytic transglycosylase domain-containing protein [Treponema sp.]
MQKLYLRKIAVLLLITAESAVLAGCGNQSVPAPQKDFGIDSNYFIGLQALKNGDQHKAERLFLSAAKKGTPYIAQRSALEFARIGTVQERIKKYRKLISPPVDEQTLSAAATEFYAAGEYALVIAATDRIDVTTCSTALARLRFESMYKKSDSRLEKELYAWFTQRPVSDDHYQFYKKYLFGMNNEPAGSGTTATDSSSGTFRLSNAEYSIILFRIQVYRRDFGAASVFFPTIAALTNFALPRNKTVPQIPLVVSDMGKTSLYGTRDWKADASFFLDTARHYEQKTDKTSRQIVFYSYFYAGRLYSKGNGYYTKASENLLSAVASAPDRQSFDNALWYYLNVRLSVSTDAAIDAVAEYCHQWHDPGYFDDFFESLADRLLADHKWNDFYRVYKIIDRFADDATVAKYAYLCGRLVQENMAAPVGNKEEMEKEAFSRALKSGNDFYYKIMAAGQLGITGADLEKVLSATKINPDFMENSDAERLLTGYAEFGFPEKIYGEWTDLDDDTKKGITLSTAEKLASFLKSYGDNLKNPSGSGYYPQGLRIAAGTASYSDRPLDRKMMEQLYPRNFSTETEAACSQFGIPEYILYALIRSESFFDAGIESHAGAKGLTQLMDTTAGDISQKIHKTDFDLKDPQTNIEFGGYYLAEMIRRLDGPVILAFFAYNGGITRVRRWVRNSQLELGKTGTPPYDLFLETLPFEETREYGRKLVSAAVLYGWLYYNKTPEEVIEEIF